MVRHIPMGNLVPAQLQNLGTKHHNWNIVFETLGIVKMTFFIHRQNKNLEPTGKGKER